MSAINPALEWSVALFEVGDTNSCIYSWCCPSCATASARHEIDGSDFWYNLFCIGGVTSRWLARTSYGIVGDSTEDILVGTFCTCCSTNQTLQTARARGRAVVDGGKEHNKGRFEKDLLRFPSVEGKEMGTFLYSCACLPCAVGSLMQDAMGMPWLIGCCCTHPMAARNILRYHYRIAGDDMREECVYPACATGVANQCGPLSVALQCVYALVFMQMHSEVRMRGVATEGYLRERGNGSDTRNESSFPLIAPSAPANGSQQVVWVTPIAIVDANGTQR